MSHHVVLTPEAQAALKRQKAQATLSSLIISILSIVLVGLILFLIAISSVNITQPDVIVYKANSRNDTETKPEQVNPTLQRKPSSPPNALARVVTSNSVSALAIPVPDFDAPTQSVDFGDSGDFGGGWSSAGEGSDSEGGTSFFGQKSEARRIAFVIDYSASMNGERVVLMKEELTKSLDQLQPGTDYQMIFFAGPVWVAGSTVKFRGSEAKDGNIVVAPDGTEYRWDADGGASSFSPKGIKQKATWLTVPNYDNLLGAQRREAQSKGKKILNKSKKIVEETPLVYGTRWRYALEMALEMVPAPEVIYFMTDGSTGKEAQEVAEKVGRTGKSRGITINCIAMMEPRSHEAMKEMAKRTGGKFTVVEEGGVSIEVPLN